MKDISKKFLIESLEILSEFLTSSDSEGYSEHSFLHSKNNPIFALYSEYSSLEIDSYNKIINATNEFFDFLKDSHLYQSNNKMAFIVNRACKIITRKINQFASNNLGFEFANTVTSLSPSKPENTHILDVGPGIVPYSSLALAQSTKKVSAMDKLFLFSNQSLESMNVQAFEQFFDQNTNIDDFDFVVGSCPCTAIPYIVQKCKEQDKPYFLLLCDCAMHKKNLPIINEFAELGLYTWDKILPELDPHITLFEDYAFNLGFSPEIAKRILSKINSPNHKKIIPLVSADKLVFDLEDIHFDSPDLSQVTWTKE